MRILASLLFALALGAQDVKQEVKVAPGWKAGDVVRLEYLRTREDSRRPESNGTSRTPVRLEVLEAGASGFQVRWTNGKTEMGAQQVVPEAVKRLSAQVETMPLVMALDAVGEFQRVFNEAEVKQKMAAMIEALGKELALDEKTMGTIRSMFSGDALVATAAGDAQVYFGMNGMVMKVGQPIETKTQMPFPMNPGTTLPATLVLELVGVEGKLARFRSVITFEKEGLAAAMGTVLQKAGMKAEDLPKLPVMSIVDEGVTVFDTEARLVVEASVDRRTNMGALLARRDKKEFRLVGVERAKN
jgi:hypothetical protein